MCAEIRMVEAQASVGGDGGGDVNDQMKGKRLPN